MKKQTTTTTHALTRVVVERENTCKNIVKYGFIIMIMMWGVHTKAQAPTPMPTYKHGLDMQGSNKYNTYRTDNTVANGTQVQTSDFTGEFQLFVNAINNHWIKVRELNSSYIEYFSYRIENVGYPFLPNCDNSDFNNRKFVIANSSTYSYPRYQISGLTNVTHVFNEINREIENQYPNSNSFNVAQPIYKNGELVKHVQLNRPMTLVSDFYKSGFNANLPLNRYYLPQGIFKITYYLEAGCENEVYADSVSFMVDCTRGNYNKYPFYPINFNNEAKAVYHDLSFFGYLGMPPNYNQSSNSFNTLNYVIPSSVYTGKQACNEIYTNPNLGTPTGYNSNYELPIFNNTTSYILSADYSLNLFENRSGVGAGTYAGYRDNNGTQTLSPGIPHTYTIDSPFDITQINPDEKVFYNPSVVSITSPYLVFPAGYTFKTVRGLYPTATQVYTEQAAQQANTGNAYRTSFTYDDPRHVYIPTDLAKSIYNVESGATLYIQPCVTIWDAQINVKTGGKLVYDPTKTYGNYTIVNQGGTIVATTYDEEVCTECNYPNKYNYLNHNVTANYTYTAGIHRIRDYVQVNAGATLTIPANCNLQMGPNSYIVVKPGGKLYLQGKISGRCGMQWQGIIVEGNPTQAQTYSSTTGRYTNQGYVYAYGGSIVNAETAIRAGYLDPNSQVATFTGGVVKLLNSTKIRATNKGIALYDYDKPNYQSTFNGVNFNNQYPVKTVKADGTTATNYVANTTYYHIRGIKNFGVLNSNTFSNSIAEHWQTPTEYGTAVWAQNSSINVSSCTFGNRVWKGLDYYSTDPLLNCSISDNVFDRCTQAVILNSGSFGKVYRNSFAVGAYGAGLLNYGHTNILVTENTFTNTANLSNNKGIIQNISGANSRIYRNTFSNIKTEAIRTENDNTGLNIDCNTYTNNVIDWNIASGTLKNQGLCDVIGIPPAANTFSLGCNGVSTITINKEPIATFAKYSRLSGNAYDIPCPFPLNSFTIEICPNNPSNTNSCSALAGYGSGTSSLSASARTTNINTATTNEQKTHHTNELVRLYLETGQTALAKQVLANSNSDWAKLILLKHAIANNTADVATLISAMPNNQAISNLISDNNNTRYFKNIDAQNLNTQMPDSTDIDLTKQARWSYVNNMQINRIIDNTSNYQRYLPEFEQNKISDNAIKIYPNPSDKGFIVANTSNENILVKIFSNTGVLIEQKELQNTQIFIGENYSKGVYYIQYNQPAGIKVVSKFVKL